MTRFLAFILFGSVPFLGQAQSGAMDEFSHKITSLYLQVDEIRLGAEGKKVEEQNYLLNFYLQPNADEWNPRLAENIGSTILDITKPGFPIHLSWTKALSYHLLNKDAQVWVRGFLCLNESNCEHTKFVEADHFSLNDFVQNKAVDVRLNDHLFLDFSLLYADRNFDLTFVSP